ncbi:hypothetical protein CRENBAI_006223 [Crenichthys baileyi]|uniref:Uncharacterized protein n=1 Tax=Crenichthys baileyi TaxID=28760 RepID=A0AAV9RUR4_9TELE
MAAGNYFPSIHDKMENRSNWPLFDTKLKKINSLPINMRRDSQNKTSSVNWNCSPTQGVKAPSTCQTSNLLMKVPDYRPLDVFAVTAEDLGPALWNDEDEICELCIRLKEFELYEMMQDSAKIQCRSTGDLGGGDRCFPSSVMSPGVFKQEAESISPFEC